MLRARECCPWCGERLHDDICTMFKCKMENKNPYDEIEKCKAMGQPLKPRYPELEYYLYIFKL